MSTPIGRPAFASTARIACIRSLWSACVPWLKLRRNTSTPRWNSSRIISGVELAGPSVATIFAFRSRRMLSFRKKGAIVRPDAFKTAAGCSRSLADLVIGHDLERTHQRRMIQLRAAVRGTRVEELLCGRRVGEGDAERPRVGEREIQVL